MSRPRPVPAAGGASLHRRIRDDLERRILSGDWPPGHRVPVEHELMAAYDCSRMTVNKVLTELAAAGLVERRRRAGTFVSKPRPPSALLEIPDVKAEILALGLAYGLHFLDRRTRASSAADMHRLGVTTPREVLALRYLHIGGGRPFALEDRLIDLSSVPDAAGETFASEPPGSWLLAHVPWSEAEHRIRAIGADTETAHLLDLPPAAACLVLERRTWRNGAPVTAARTVFPAGGYELVARFHPGSGRDGDGPPRKGA
ncbi:histidine utilization repressor [Methylobrevis pamukkalensis]|uniref:Histidine utilization repressor n=1 Tax=Methylobrevis pamukkalensis TaxID=1439726 RepID=A0A1E3H1E9_9HYPH|nr:histidine utilization repressor [Methylobrevis pamukkalensis]ODN69391.1 HTH-type transcriptional repressor YvoA [Methylobrevis pamukkalensis]